MPLLRSRLDVHRSRARFVRRFFAAMAMLTLVFLAVIAGHYVMGWW